MAKLSGLRGILFDMDGVLYDVDTLLPGAVEALAWARGRGIPHLFITNTTSVPRAALVEKLSAAGITAQVTDILTPGAAAAAWLRLHSGRVALFLRPEARAEFEDLPILPDDAESGASFVVVGDLMELWDYRTLNRAFRLLHSNPEAHLIALGMTRYWRAEDGFVLDVAPFIAALEHATGRKALAFGKPAEAFFGEGVEQLGLSANQVAMLGDDIQTDVAGAQRAGLKGILVKTGKFKLADLTGDVTPDGTLDSVADLPRWWNEQREGKSAG